jgi:hypothetical protein
VVEIFEAATGLRDPCCPRSTRAGSSTRASTPRARRPARTLTAALRVRHRTLLPPRLPAAPSTDVRTGGLDRARRTAFRNARHRPRAPRPPVNPDQAPSVVYQAVSIAGSCGSHARRAAVSRCQCAPAQRGRLEQNSVHLLQKQLVVPSTMEAFLHAHLSRRQNANDITLGGNHHPQPELALHERHSAPTTPHESGRHSAARPPLRQLESRELFAR